MMSLTCSLGSVAATRAGMMKDGLADGLPSASSTRPNGVSSSITNVFLSVDAILDSEAIRSRPIASLAPQRLIDATQSSAVTGWSSWNLRPSRSGDGYFIASLLPVHLATICGWWLWLAREANRVAQ